MSFLRKYLPRRVLRLLAYCAVWGIASGMVFLLVVHQRTDARYKRRIQAPARTKRPYDPKACNPVFDTKLNVHLIAHTHDDVGWVDTIDGYYRRQVNAIISTTIKELLKDPQRRFIYVEMAFFSIWWKQQTPEMQQSVKMLVEEGRLEFTLGGWSMNDEATTHYNAIIDQHTLGLQFLNNTFGHSGRPTIAWQIDPFGHSREQASLFAEMGFEGLFVGRIDHHDKEERERSKTMEMVWRGNKNIGRSSDLFTGVLPNLYQAPNGFCFDIVCGLPEINEQNMNMYIERFISEIRKEAMVYKTNHISMTMGGDFTYTQASRWFNNLDKLIKYTNEMETSINVLYSTPSCYLHHLHKRNIVWPTKHDDFFPYADQPHRYWTGYFTSRPAFKYYVRKSNNFLQACKQLSVLANLPEDSSDVDVLREAMGVAQHHDAVTGTEKTFVLADYVTRLTDGTSKCQDVFNHAYDKLMTPTEGATPVLKFCDHLNASVCYPTTTNAKFDVVLYNPLARPVKHWVRVPVVYESYIVKNANGLEITTQIFPVTNTTNGLPERKDNEAKYELLFQADLVPMGYSTYYVSSSEERTARGKLHNMDRKEDFFIDNKILRLEFNGATGLLKQIINLQKGIKLDILQELMFYDAFGGNNYGPDSQASGAYVFRPKEDMAYAFQLVKTSVIKGALVHEVHHSFSTWVNQVIRLYHDANYVEIEWTVGPIGTRTGTGGTEVVSKFSTGLDNKGKFYTDANGRQMIERRRNHRDTWVLKQSEPTAGNYYPINSRIYMQDTKKNIQLTVLTDRSQGGGSIQDGNLEIMLHRQLLQDDSLGVGESLMGRGSDGNGIIARGKHFVFVDTIKDSTRLHREMALQLFMSPIIAFNDKHSEEEGKETHIQSYWSGIKNILPRNVHMVTLQQWNNNTYLIRLEHIYEKNEDIELSKPAKVSLENLFSTFEIIMVEELTLAGNMYKDELHRMEWNFEGDIDDNRRKPEDDTGTSRYVSESYDVWLQPMQIRTFEITVECL